MQATAGTIDFKLIASDALRHSRGLVPSWLPGGKLVGSEYQSLNPTRADSKVGSFSVNLDNGKWADFATGDRGSDLISLYAYIQSLEQIEAAKAVADQLGLDKSVGNTDKLNQPQQEPIKPSSRTWYEPVLPVPTYAPPHPVAHPVRGKPEAMWPYFDAEERLLGVVYRFERSEGGKEVLPCVYARHKKSGKEEWRWMSFPVPRPLYGLDRLALFPKTPVLLVEGEKCVDAGADHLLNVYVVVSWPGGGKAVDKVDWSPLKGRVVIAWPDCDAQVDKNKNLLEEHKQPGYSAMLRIKELVGNQVESFRLVDIPLPGEKPDGWDIADAIDDGMDQAAIVEMIQRTDRRIAPSSTQPSARAKAKRKAASSEEPPPERKQIGYLPDRYALIYSTNTVYDINTNLIMSVEAMRLAVGKSHVDWWLSSDKRKMILPDQLVFDPSGQAKPPEINMFRGIEMVPEPTGDYAPILELLTHLCAESAETDQGVTDVFDWVLKWLALPLQKPGTKMRSALIFHGTQGAGKNLFFEIVAKIYGRHAIVVGQEQLEEKHNDWCSAKLFMIGDEVIARNELYHQKNKLKAFITGDTIQINPKYLPIRTERNHVNVVFLSNEDQPLVLEESDRRYFVVYTPHMHKGDLYQRVADCLDNGGAEAFYAHLLGLDLHGFNAFAMPPMTTAKRNLIALSLRPEHRFVYEWICGHLSVPLSPCTAGQLFRVFEHWTLQNRERLVSQRKFTATIDKYVKLLSNRANRERPMLNYKVVKLDRETGQKSERVWIPDGFERPERETEGRWLAGFVERFEEAIRVYRGVEIGTGIM